MDAIAQKGSGAALKNVADVYGLSSMQQLMLVHNVSDPDSPLLSERLECTLKGSVYPDLMERAWGLALARHTALRTAFLWEGLPRPLQVVRREVAVPWEFVDTRGTDDSLDKAPRRKLDPTQAPLFHLRLTRVADEEYRFVWSIHHLISDGWCLSPILSEVFRCYLAFRRDQSPNLPPARPFRDYINWLERQNLERAKGHWRRTFDRFQAPSLTGRPFRVRSGGEASLSRHELRLSRDETAACKALAARRRVSMGAFLSGVWALVLGKYSNLDDFAIGMAVSGRPTDLPGVETIVGPFMNNVPARAKTQAGDRVWPWLTRWQEQQLDGRRFEYAPLSSIHEWLETPRGGALFESLFVYENYPLDDTLRTGDGWLDFEVSGIEASVETLFPLTLVAAPGQELTLSLSIDSGRFGESSGPNLLADTRKALSALVSGEVDSVDDLLGKLATEGGFPRLTLEAVQTPHNGQERVAPRDDFETRMAAIWSDLLGPREWSVKEGFFEAGGDSVLAVRLMSRVEESFGKKLSLAALFQRATIEHLAELLRKEESAGPRPSLVCLQPRGEAPPLFCVHPAGGTVFCYLELARRLRSDHPLFGLQAPGVDGEATPLASLSEMATRYAGEIAAAYPLGPYYLLGWSLGGILAFEVARRLEEQGRKVALLAILDAAIKPPGTPFTEDDFLPVLIQMFPHEDRPELERMKSMTPVEQLEFFRSRADQAGLLAGDPREAARVATAGAVQDQHVFHVFQANLRAMLDYTPGPYVGRVTLFRAADDATPMHSDPLLGWGPWAAGGVEKLIVPGEHVDMFREPGIDVIAARLQERMDDLESPRA